MLTRELDYDLPPRCIATHPAEPRDAAKLMVVNRADGSVKHLQVRDLPSLVTPAQADRMQPPRIGIPPRPGDLLIFNRTQVLPAAFQGVRTRTGGKTGGLYIDSPAAQPHDKPKHADDRRPQWHVMLESRGTLQVGEQIDLDTNARLELIERVGPGRWRARLHADADTLAVLQRIGTTPLPPYIRKQRKALGLEEVGPDDGRRYNTVLASEPGSVAAPTAALHFTDELLHRLDAAGLRRATLTLHIGLGTFAPIRADTVEQHDIHSEWMHVPADTLEAIRRTREAGGRIIPIGTTSVRALESLPDLNAPAAFAPDGSYSTNTRLFITPQAGAFRCPGSAPGSTESSPAWPFRFTDSLLTNFHLPRSTLLALVAALPGVGLPRLLGWYRTAIAEDYRFYSYGDAMLIL